MPRIAEIDPATLPADAREIFELTFRIALCGFFNRVNDSLQISMEDGVVEDPESVGANLDGLPQTATGGR